MIRYLIIKNCTGKDRIGRDCHSISRWFRFLVVRAQSLAFLVFSILFIGSCASTGSVSERQSGLRDASARNAHADMPPRNPSLARQISRDPKMLEQLSLEDTKSALNGLSLERKEASNINLQFKSNLCVLDLYYASSGNDMANVSDEAVNKSVAPSHIEMRSIAEGRDIDQTKCIKSLL
jgi:hypothetical protein